MRAVQWLAGLLLAAVALLGSVSCSGSSSSSSKGSVVGTDGGYDAGTGGGAVKDVSHPQDTFVPAPDIPDTASEPDVTVENERFGKGCEEHADCAGGWCIEGPDGLVCTVECVDTCPAGWGCRGVPLFGESEQISVCMPKSVEVCRSCKGPSDCGGVPLCALGVEATG